MRKIKFRAWDSFSKQFVKLEITSGNEFFKLEKPEDMNLLYQPKGRFENLVWQQYTGLVDKYGKEIYEGDILLADDGGERFPEEYNETKDEWEPIGKYEIYWADTCYWLRDLNGQDIESEYSPFFDATFEVISNIYESRKPIDK